MSYARSRLLNSDSVRKVLKERARRRAYTETEDDYDE